ncbi:MAG TPA: hypothetical protein VE288_05750 [Rubrobacteraceae bacterium]|nr:hypothetical protein [Rubrobacteraceae bacterium]
MSSLLQDPEKIRTGMNALIEQERSADSRNVGKELVVWAKKVEECDHLRSAYQNQQAAGLMTLEELGANLTELDNMCKTAEQELVTLKNRRERIEELEKDRDILLKSMADRVPRALYDLTDEEKHKLYQMLRIEAAPCEEGYAVNGAICTWEPIREYTDRP